MLLREMDGGFAAFESQADYTTQSEVAIVKRFKKERSQIPKENKSLILECHLEYIREASKIEPQPDLVQGQWLPWFP